MRSWGEFTAPDARTTSLRASASASDPFRVYTTPVARFPSKVTKLAWAPVTTVRFFRLPAGLMYAPAGERRAPLRCVTWQ